MKSKIFVVALVAVCAFFFRFSGFAQEQEVPPQPPAEQAVSEQPSSGNGPLSKEELAQMLHEENGVERFNAYRQKLMEKIIAEFNASKTKIWYSKFEDIDLSGLDLSSIDLSEANLGHADLRGVNLSKSVLRNANLFNANIEGAKFYQTDFDGADLRYVNTSGGFLEARDFEGVNIWGAGNLPKEFREEYIRLLRKSWRED